MKNEHSIAVNASKWFIIIKRHFYGISKGGKKYQKAPKRHMMDFETVLINGLSKSSLLYSSWILINDRQITKYHS